jgi:hypothetical protein
MADNLPPSSVDVTKSGSLNLPEPSGPHRPSMGLFYFTQLLFLHLAFSHFCNFGCETWSFGERNGYRSVRHKLYREISGLEKDE